MRDLPPQAQAIVLQHAELLTYELPAATFLLKFLPSVLPVATTDRAEAGPPGGLSEAERPHAAPVGIVRLLT